MKNKTKWLWFLLMGVLLGWTIYTVLREQTPGQLAYALLHADWRFLLLGLGLSGFFVALEAGASFVILRALGSPQPYQRCLLYSCTGFFFSNVTPSASGGQPAQIYRMSKDGVPVVRGGIDMLLVTIAYQTAAVIFGIAALAVCPDLAEVLGGKVGVLLGIGLTVFIAMDVGMILFLFLPGPIRRAGLWGIGVLCRVRPAMDRKSLEDGLGEQLEHYSRGARLIRTSPALLPAVLALIAGQLACSYTVPWIICLSFHVPGASFAQVFALQALCAVAVGYLPLPGSAGAAENVFLRAFTHIFGAGLVAPAMILSRCVSCYLPLIVTGTVTAVSHICRPAALPVNTEKAR